MGLMVRRNTHVCPMLEYSECRMLGMSKARNVESSECRMKSIWVLKTYAWLGFLGYKGLMDGFKLFVTIFYCSFYLSGLIDENIWQIKNVL